MGSEDSKRRAADGAVHALRWPLTTIVVSVFAFLAADRACTTADRAAVAPAHAAEGVIEAFSGIAERFRSGRITQTFRADLPRLVPAGAARLEVATFEAVEELSRSDERRVLFDLVDLGTNVTSLRVPATYRYHLRLDDPWRLETRDRTCVVEAPALRATLPPAIHTDRLESRAERGWLRAAPEQQMAALLRELTPALERRAVAPETLRLVREEARRTVAAFVRGWLLREAHWRDDRFTAVSVVFADEDAASPEPPAGPTFAPENAPPAPPADADPWREAN
jgi:hypothetical protein